MRYGVVGYTLMVLCIVAGVISNGSLHIGTMLYVADAIHFFTLFYYIWVPLKELGNVQRRLDSELGNPADTYLSTMRIGFYSNFTSLYIVAAVTLCLWAFGTDFAFAVHSQFYGAWIQYVRGGD